VVYAFLEGLSPESIADSCDTLTLEEVYGALAFYLGHRDEIDAYLKRSEAQFDELCRHARAANPLLYRKLDEARQRLMGRSREITLAGHLATATCDPKRAP
jgi:hypothetical protein